MFLVLSVIQPAGAYATSGTTVTGSWLISQAAGQSSGQAPTVKACGTFSLSILSSSNPAANSGTFSGVLSFQTEYPSSGSAGLILPTSEAVSGAWMKQAGGALFVSFAGSSPIAVYGSFSSPSLQPSPSATIADGCNPVPTSLGLGGFVQLPGQGTEGIFIYSANTVTSL